MDGLGGMAWGLPLEHAGQIECALPDLVGGSGSQAYRLDTDRFLSGLADVYGPGMVEQVEPASADDGEGGGMSLRAMLGDGHQFLSVFSIIPSPEIIELIALSGFDLVIIDMEHGPFALETVRTGLIAARARDMPAVVRVPSCEESVIGAVLDAGADGVLVPRVRSAAAARAAVAASRFAPDGTRGAHPWVRAAGYGAVTDWFAAANEQVAVMVMIEGSDGISAVPEILDVSGVDVIFLGPVDLSHSMGVPGQLGHPLVRAAMERVVTMAAASGRSTAVFAPR